MLEKISPDSNVTNTINVKQLWNFIYLIISGTLLTKIVFLEFKISYFF